MYNFVKYPRTFHLPWSLSKTEDDKTLTSVRHFEGKEVVVTEKMDGENTTIYNKAFHARSIDSRHHSSRDWVAKLQSDIGYLIPDGMRVCGENVYARHSVSYSDLPSFFLGFSVWENEKCLSWDETTEWFELLGICPVPVLWRGVFDENTIREIGLDFDKQEGYVVRYADSFLYSDFSMNVAKFVRKNHVQSDKHWMHKEVVLNQLTVV